MGFSSWKENMKKNLTISKGWLIFLIINAKLKDRLVTRAVLYFTGDAQAAEREDDFDDDMFGEGEDAEDPDFEPPVSVSIDAIVKAKFW